MAEIAIGGRTDLVPIRFDPVAERDAWLAERRHGIGGSDAPAVLGESPYRSAIDVFLDRTGATVPISLANDERAFMGQIWEPIVLDMFAKGGELWPRDGGPWVVVKPPTVYRKDAPWRRGSADGFGYYPEHNDLGLLEYKPDFLVEVKTHGWFASRAYDMVDNDPVVSVPPDKRIQCAWYMALYDVNMTYLACLVDTHLRRTFVIHRDHELEEMILEECDRFWRHHVLTGIAPPPDGTASYRKYLGQRFRTHSDAVADATPELNKAVTELLEIKRRQKVDEKRREAIEQLIKLAIGGGMGVKTSSGLVTWKSQASGKIRSEAYAELYRVAGWTDEEIASFEERFRVPDHRVLRVPNK